MRPRPHFNKNKIMQNLRGKVSSQLAKIKLHAANKRQIRYKVLTMQQTTTRTTIYSKRVLCKQQQGIKSTRVLSRSQRRNHSKRRNLLKHHLVLQSISSLISIKESPSSIPNSSSAPSMVALSTVVRSMFRISRLLQSVLKLTQITRKQVLIMGVHSSMAVHNSTVVPNTVVRSTYQVSFSSLSLKQQMISHNSLAQRRITSSRTSKARSSEYHYRQIRI